MFLCFSYPCVFPEAERFPNDESFDEKFILVEKDDNEQPQNRKDLISSTTITEPGPVSVHVYMQELFVISCILN